MAQKTSSSQIKSDVVTAAIRLAGKDGWRKITMAKLAKTTGHAPSRIDGIFGSVHGVAAGAMDDLSKRTRDVINGHLGDNWKDNLLEIILTRLDIAAQDKRAYGELPRFLLAQPDAVLKFLPAFATSTGAMLKEAGFENIRGPARRALLRTAFAALYLSIVDAWSREGEDGDKIMALADKRISQFAQLAEKV